MTVEASVIGRCGKVATGYGHVVAVDGSGLYYKFKRPGKIKSRWYHRDDVQLHEPTPCVPCNGTGESTSGVSCGKCCGSGLHEYRIPLDRIGH